MPDIGCAIGDGFPTRRRGFRTFDGFPSLISQINESQFYLAPIAASCSGSRFGAFVIAFEVFGVLLGEEEEVEALHI